MTNSTAVSADEYRAALSRFCTGVAIVTAMPESGVPVGMTVGSFSSVSLDPPLVSFYVDHGSTTFPSIAETGRFCVNILSGHQGDLCRKFSRRSEDRFDGIDWSTSDSGAVRLDAVHAWIECSIFTVQTFGDHDLVVGRVEVLAVEDGETAPLVFYRSKLWPLATNVA